jgi:hypothetical protein
MSDRIVSKDLFISHMNCKGTEGNVCDLIWGDIPAFDWSDWQKPRKTSTTAGPWAEIWVQDLRNMKQEWKSLGWNVESFLRSW